MDGSAQEEGSLARFWSTWANTVLQLSSFEAEREISGLYGVESLMRPCCSNVSSLTQLDISCNRGRGIPFCLSIFNSPCLKLIKLGLPIH